MSMTCEEFVIERLRVTEEKNEYLKNRVSMYEKEFDNLLKDMRTIIDLFSFTDKDYRLFQSKSVYEKWEPEEFELIHKYKRIFDSHKADDAEVEESA